jgi:hypothetical protein
MTDIADSTEDKRQQPRLMGCALHVNLTQMHGSLATQHLFSGLSAAQASDRGTDRSEASCLRAWSAPKHVISVVPASLGFIYPKLQTKCQNEDQTKFRWLLYFPFDSESYFKYKEVMYHPNYEFILTNKNDHETPFLSLSSCPSFFFKGQKLRSVTQRCSESEG